MSILLAIIDSIVIALGQILLKLGVGRIGDTAATYFNAYIIAGLVLYILSVFFLRYILRKADVSAIYPILALAYLWVTMIGGYGLREEITYGKSSMNLSVSGWP